MADWTPKKKKKEKIYNTRVQVRGLITNKEDISTLQRPFQERLPVNLTLFEILITLVLFFLLFKKKLFVLLLFKCPILSTYYQG